MDKEGATKVAGRLAKTVGIAAFIYVGLLGAYSLVNFGITKSRLLSYGVNESTATLLSWAVMFLAIALPLAAASRIITLRAKPIDYAAVMVLPLIAWGIKQIPANFDAVTGEALKYCAERPDRTLFCLDRPGVDPLTQKTLEPISAETAIARYKRDRGVVPQRIDLPFAEIRFFDPIEQKPVVWIFQTRDGCFEAFDNPGIHPVEGVPLVAVTSADIDEMRACLARREAQIQKAITDKKADDERAKRETLLQQEAMTREKEKAAQAEWGSFDAALSSAPKSWNENPSWRNDIAGKQVRIEYTDRRRFEALEIARRLNALGANVLHSHVPPTGGESVSHLMYSFASFEAADSIRAAAINISRLELLSSDSGVRQIEIVLH